jgi:hypothetical protein
MRSIAHAVAAVTCLCLTLCCAVGHADRFRPEQLFVLSFGSAQGQIGVWLPPSGGDSGAPEGPTAIAAGPDGSVYIADRVNKRIQRFTTRGELLMAAKGPVERKSEHATAYERGQATEVPPRMEELDNLQSIAVDAEGCVYAQFGAAADLIAKFAADGQALWYLAIADAIPPDVIQMRGSSYGGLSIAIDGSISIRLSGRSADGIAILDGQGNYLRMVDGDLRAPSGEVASLDASVRSALAVNVRMYDAGDTEVARFEVQPAALDPGLFAGATGVSVQWFDGAGRPYAFAGGARAQRAILSPQLTVPSDRVIVRCDGAGRPLAGVRFPGSPFLTGRSVTVDASGNIYRLAYAADSARVIRYGLDTSVPDYTSVWEPE